MPEGGLRGFAVMLMLGLWLVSSGLLAAYDAMLAPPQYARAILDNTSVHSAGLLRGATLRMGGRTVVVDPNLVPTGVRTCVIVASGPNSLMAFSVRVADHAHPMAACSGTARGRER